MIGFHEKNAWLSNTFLLSQEILRLDIPFAIFILLDSNSLHEGVHECNSSLPHICLDDNASPEVVHCAFPISKIEGPKKRRK